MNDLTEQDRERLTEYLGGCWHKVKRPKHEPTVFSKPCVKCRGTITIIRDEPIDGNGYGNPYRTFTTPNDFFALREKLAEKGEWLEFEYFALLEKSEVGTSLTQWLINAPRFCWLVNEWLKGKEVKKG